MQDHCLVYSNNEIMNFLFLEIELTFTISKILLFHILILGFDKVLDEKNRIFYLKDTYIIPVQALIGECL